jgi:hypothetical protein
MSSVQRFIRQIQPHHAFYKAADVVGAVVANAFEFAPDASNVVGNYPPGTMNAASSALINSIAGLNTLSSGNLILRDMGKTVQAALSTAPNGAKSFYRQVQLISLVSGVNGKVDEPNKYTDYLTFYVPITIGGSATAVLPLIAGACQM